MRARERGKVPLDERGTNTTRSLYKRTHKLTRPPLRRGVYRRQLSTERDALFGPSTLSGLARKPTGPTWSLLYHYHPPPPALLPLSPSPSPPLPPSSPSSLHSLDTRRVSLMCHHYQRIANHHHHHRHHLLPTGRLYLSSRLPRTRQRKRESEREGE